MNASIALPITGKTRLYAMLGNPVAQVRSPEVFNPLFASSNKDALLFAAQSEPAHLTTVVAGLKAMANLDGLFVTIPHKVAMLQHADRVLPNGLRVGAVNALRREPDGSWTADMFDGQGFVAALLGKGLSAEGKRAQIYGAGGAGMAIAVALADAGANAINLCDTDAVKAQSVASHLQAHCPDCQMTANAPAGELLDVLINASPVGMRPEDGLPGSLQGLHAHSIIGDVIISHVPTALIRHARSSGYANVDGADMHAGQVQALARFFGF
ncbi:shikimate dehydrogenase family protein [Pseudomonas sp. UBA1879]|uniref:shikimate dehydrogenase family protein n=1 Tax=Pseudomonas sp. UBA1879 TaxID=1947305 RepID=UPI0025DF4712|nr:hypothetical protein [Pseudomonas sp. UBA1879]